MNQKLDRREAAKFLSERGFKIATTTLAKYACLGGGPVYEKFGRRPLYTEASLMEWVASKMSGQRQSTSDPGTD